MFNEFLKFVGYKPNFDILTTESLLETLSGMSFLNGALRFFKNDQRSKWTEIVEEYYTKYKGHIDVICYDWLGRIFAISSYSNTVVFFEPGTGYVYNTDSSVENFFNSDVVEYTNDCFATNFFGDWNESLNYPQLLDNECASYIVPLFLGGSDSTDNLEVCDMEVHWEMMRITHNLSADDIDGDK